MTFEGLVHVMVGRQHAESVKGELGSLSDVGTSLDHRAMHTTLLRTLFSTLFSTLSSALFSTLSSVVHKYIVPFL